MPSTAELMMTLRDKPGAEHMRAIFDRYRALMGVGDIDGIMALFAEDAAWEEPIGTHTERGRAAIRARYEAALAGCGGRIPMVADGAVRVAGHHAIGLSIATVVLGGVEMKVETGNAIACNEQGEITEMRIYFSPASIRTP